LERKIGFMQIPELIEASMERHRIIERPDVEEILQAERETYEFIGQVVN
jgi:1-deoxy-D-xylulose-5-phosphate reductoisomerase